MSILSQAAIFILASIIIVPLFSKLRLGSILGYIVAGAIVGPALGLLDGDLHQTQHFSEFGIVMMMFLIGLELKPAEIWRMRYLLLGLGAMQIVLSAIIIYIIATIAGYSLSVAITLGLVLALSSTAIVLQILADKNQLSTITGRSCLAVLLAQDISVIPMFSLMPLLAIGAASNVATDHSIIISLPIGFKVVLILATFASFIVIGRLYLSSVFRYIASLGLTEIFTALVLFIVIGSALIMEGLGLSSALGSFMAGVILSDNEYRYEIESQISPFKGLLMGVFFITVGAGLDLGGFFYSFFSIVFWTAVIIIVKIGVLLALGYISGLRKCHLFRFALLLAQGGEFAFVLFSFVGELGIIDHELISQMTSSVILSMILTPIMLYFFELHVAPLFYSDSNAGAQEDEVPSSNIIIAGAGRFGQIIARILQANDYLPTILDSDDKVVTMFRKYKAPAYYGDVMHPELLVAAGIKEAQYFVVATDDYENMTTLVRKVKQYHPNIFVIARAKGRRQVYELEKAGADFVIRELYESSLLAAERLLVALGANEKTAASKVRKFKKHDQDLMHKMQQYWDDQEIDQAYYHQVEAARQELNRIMQEEQKSDA